MASFTLQPGDVVGEHYRLRQMIGAGGMGAVWSARNQATGAFVAIKFLHPALLRNPILVQRFLQESEAGKQAKHPNIIEVYGSGRHAPAGAKESVPYLVIELLEGESLTDLLLREARLGLDTGLVIMRDVARAAHAAHQAGVVHRDLKPANIFLHHDAQGAVIAKMLDFGISKLTDPALDAGLTTTGMLVGSPSTMSPEQAMGKRDIDGRSDVWSIGAMLFRCLTGKPLFSVTSPEAMLLKLLDEEVPLEDTSVLPPASAPSSRAASAAIAPNATRPPPSSPTPSTPASPSSACRRTFGARCRRRPACPRPTTTTRPPRFARASRGLCRNHDWTAPRLAVAVPARKPAGWVVRLRRSWRRRRAAVAPSAPPAPARAAPAIAATTTPAPAAARLLSHRASTGHPRPSLCRPHLPLSLRPAWPPRAPRRRPLPQRPPRPIPSRPLPQPPWRPARPLHCPPSSPRSADPAAGDRQAPAHPTCRATRDFRPDRAPRLPLAASPSRPRAPGAWLDRPAGGEPSAGGGKPSSRPVPARFRGVATASGRHRAVRALQSLRGLLRARGSAAGAPIAGRATRSRMVIPPFHKLLSPLALAVAPIALLSACSAGGSGRTAGAGDIGQSSEAVTVCASGSTVEASTCPSTRGRSTGRRWLGRGEASRSRA